MAGPFTMIWDNEDFMLTRDPREVLLRARMHLISGTRQSLDHFSYSDATACSLMIHKIRELEHDRLGEFFQKGTPEPERAPYPFRRPVTK